MVVSLADVRGSLWSSFARAFVVTGRSSRSEMAALLGTGAALGFAAALVGALCRGPSGAIPGVVVALVFAVPVYSCIVRRLHDTARSGVLGTVWAALFVIHVFAVHVLRGTFGALPVAGTVDAVALSGAAVLTVFVAGLFAQAVLTLVLVLRLVEPSRPGDNAYGVPCKP